MSIMPWQSFQLLSNLNRSDLLRLMKRSVPGTYRWSRFVGDAPYFCGSVDVGKGSFRFQRNVSQKTRRLLPQLRGRVVSGHEGSIIEVFVSPGFGFWIGMLPAILFLSLIPLGLVAWLFDLPMQEGSPLGLVMISFFGLIGLSWLWGVLLYLTYSGMARYRIQLSMLLDRMSERAPNGLSVLDVPETPEQFDAKQQLRIMATRRTTQILAGILVVMGACLLKAGVEGVFTQRLTTFSRNRHPVTGNAQPRMILTGTQAVVASESLIALGAGLALAAGTCLFVSRRQSHHQSWPPWAAAMITISVVLWLLSITLAIRAYG